MDSRIYEFIKNSRLKKYNKNVYIFYGLYFLIPHMQHPVYIDYGRLYAFNTAESKAISIFAPLTAYLMNSRGQHYLRAFIEYTKRLALAAGVIPKEYTDPNNEKYCAFINCLTEAGYFIYQKLRNYVLMSFDMYADINIRPNFKAQQLYCRRLRALEGRLIKQFLKKDMLGDIYISDAQYELLKESLKFSYERICFFKKTKIIDIIFALTLIQIGKRFYNEGRFWEYVEREVGFPIPAHRQNLFHKVFNTTLTYYDKHLAYNANNIENMLAHSFVTNEYLNAFFNFLFIYYKKDLLRYIGNNTKSSMDRLIEIMKDPVGMERGYHIRSHTSLAVKGFEKHVRNKVKRILKLMDSFFWEEHEEPGNIFSRNELKLALYEWTKYNLTYIEDRERTHRGGGKKELFTPFIQCVLSNNVFGLYLPEQIIGRIKDPVLYTWRVCFGNNKRELYGFIDSGIISKKTETHILEIPCEDIFENFLIELYVDNCVYEKFNIEAADCRIFNIKGLPAGGNIKAGEIIIYANKKNKPFSTELIEEASVTYNIGRYTYLFEDGDILRFANGKALIIGKKYDKGMQSRGLVKGALGRWDNRELSIYNKAPHLTIIIEPEDIYGTAVIVNDKKYRLSDLPHVVSEISGLSNNAVVEVDLSRVLNDKNNVYTVIVDKPRDVYVKKHEFLLLHNFSFQFLNAPYIFVNEGKAEVYCDLTLKHDYAAEKYGIYTFEIGEEDYLRFFVYIHNKIPGVEISLKIPVLKWHIEGGREGKYQWNGFNDYWKTDLPKTLTLKAPFALDKLIVASGDDINRTGYVNARSVENGVNVFDLAVFKRYFHYEHDSFDLYIAYKYLETTDKVKLFRVYVKSRVISSQVIGDFRAGTVECKINIFGLSCYYIDLINLNNNEKLINDGKLINGYIKESVPLENGFYEIKIYEAAPKSALDQLILRHIHSIKQQILDVDDLSGARIKIINIQRRFYRGFSHSLSEEYIIEIRKKLEECVYKGELVVNSENSYKHSIKVTFHNPNDLCRFFVDLYETDEKVWVPYIYNINSRTIIAEEPEKSGRDKYIKNIVLYDDTFEFQGEFLNEEIPYKGDPEIKEVCLKSC